MLHFENNSRFFNHCLYVFPQFPACCTVLGSSGFVLTVLPCCGREEEDCSWTVCDGNDLISRSTPSLTVSWRTFTPAWVDLADDLCSTFACCACWTWCGWWSVWETQNNRKAMFALYTVATIITIIYNIRHFAGYFFFVDAYFSNKYKT